MCVDFHDAAKRHFEDAEYLLKDTRLANADHLFGLSSECALKAVMIWLGMKHKKGKPEKKHHLVHINGLWNEFITFADNRNGAHYTSILTGGLNPFDDWDVSQRYRHGSEITGKIVNKHHQAAKDTRLILETAILNGEDIL